MNKRMIAYIVGWILIFEALFMILPCIVALIYKEASGFSFLITIFLCLCAGGPFVRKPPKNKIFYTREGFVTVALSLIVLSCFGALPFIISGYIPNPVDALFETVSGFTTTGASILTDVEALPYCLIFWRSFSHWIGGMGVLVFILTLLPMSGGSHMSLMKAESPGPSVSKLVPKVQSTAKILYEIYIVLTIVQIILLLIGKMPLFDALATSFGTAGTGGFGIKNDSMASYSPYLQTVTTIFMILYGINFSVYFLLLAGRPKQALQSEEARWYLGIIGVSILVIALQIRHLYPSFGVGLHHAAFQVASIITTTGFATTDFNLWPEVPRCILLLLMFAGACAGSTGGGIKISRLIILAKTVKKELYQLIHPQSVRQVVIDGRAVEHDVLRSINVFMVLYFMIFAFSVLFISVDGNDLITNFSAVAATLNNIGPGLELVGPTQNFSLFSNWSKLVMIFDMLAGRLELFPLLLILTPETWRKF